MDLGLAGGVAVVTGAGSGIGLATCAALAAEGMHVVGASRSRPDASLDGVEHLQLDLTESDAPAALVQHAVDRHGSLAVLVNNAALGRLHRGFLDATDDDWAAIFDLNMTAALHATRAALPHLTAGGGVVVNIASVNAVLPDADTPEYCASKAALVSWGKALSKEYAAQGVRVVTVSPGLTRTPMWFGPDGVAESFAARTGSTVEEIAGQAVSLVPMGRFAEPEEVADVITFLASRRASYVTGTNVFVDGGVTPTM